MENPKRLFAILGGLLVVLVIGMGLQGTKFYSPPSSERKVLPAAKANSPDGEQGASQTARKAEKEIAIHVTGAVSKPGVYRLPAGSRVEDAIRLAEALPEADVEGMNRAAPLTDGRQIVVPFRQGDGGRSGGSNESSGTGSAKSKASSGANAGTGATSRQGGSLININQADAAELDRLPGVGPSTAQKIIQYRETKGAFQRAEDLQNVPGIGPKKYADLKEMITVD
ncbi:ComEA family DNA-binding protein [Heliobacterium gestii]|uniref:ComEA family DNA-binding protein n=1 Tax=Heliomicrobium gestii TaxID=2699 RepID=A0A845L6Y4_HELGE|nr:ComEA family DNA-binding protein [Heliomicrobium gestii]MBM7868345.1 competence protein ComEA [Heliomicrobium gestii]MZP42447.1 ComEA family DNA-binding protein [Heliomicrobium gestii]